MPIWVPIAVGLVCLLIILAVAFLIPALVQMRRTAAAAEEIMREVAKELGPVLSQIREATDNLNRVAREAGKGVERIEGFTEALEGVGKTINMANSLLKGSAVKWVISTIGLVAGIRSGASQFRDRVFHRR